MELHSGKEFEVVSIRKRVRVRHLSIQCELEARTRVQKLYELVALFFPFHLPTSSPHIKVRVGSQWMAGNCLHCPTVGARPAAPYVKFNSIQFTIASGKIELLTIFKMKELI